MAHPAPSQVKEWFFERLSAHQLFELLGRDALAMIADRAVEFFYREGSLKTGDLINWLTGEYGLPREDTIQFFAQLQGEAAGRGFQIVLSGDKATPPKANLGPPPPVPPAKRPTARPGKPPSPEDHDRHLRSFLQDAAYLEWAVLDHGRGQDTAKPELVKKVLDLRFKLSDQEIELLSDPGLEPGGAGVSIADWTLRVSGLALALALANHLAGRRMDFNREQWTMAVQELLGNFEGVAIQVQSKLDQLLAADESVLAEAWRRADLMRDELAAKFELLSGEEEDTRKSRPASSNDKTAEQGALPRRGFAAPDQGLRGKVNRKPAAAASLIVVLLAAAILTSWWLSGPRTRPLEITLALDEPRVEKIESARNLMIVTVDEKSWAALDEERKRAALQVMGEAAAKAGLKDVNVLSSQNVPLGVYMTATRDHLIFR